MQGVRNEANLYSMIKRGMFWGKVFGKVDSIFEVIDKWRRQELYDAIKDFKPDHVIFGTNTLDPDFVGSLRPLCSGPIVCWYCDPPGNIRKNHIVSNEYDLVFFKDEEFALRARASLGRHAAPGTGVTKVRWGPD